MTPLADLLGVEPLPLNPDHGDMQILHIREVVKDADGTYTNKTLKAVFTDHSNVYLKDCKLD